MVSAKPPSACICMWVSFAVSQTRQPHCDLRAFTRAVSSTCSPSLRQRHGLFLHIFQVSGQMSPPQKGISWSTSYTNIISHFQLCLPYFFFHHSTVWNKYFLSVPLPSGSQPWTFIIITMGVFFFTILLYSRTIKSELWGRSPGIGIL